MSRTGVFELTGSVTIISVCVRFRLFGSCGALGSVFAERLCSFLPIKKPKTLLLYIIRDYDSVASAEDIYHYRWERNTWSSPPEDESSRLSMRVVAPYSLAVRP